MFYPLNKSITKYVCIGLNVEDFSPSIKISGNKSASVIFNEHEWNELLNYQGIITNNLYQLEIYMEPLSFANVEIYFEDIDGQKVLKIKKNEVYIYLGKDSVFNLWQLIPLLEKRLTLLKNQQFKQYLSVFKNSYVSNEDDIINKIYDVLVRQDSSSENACAVMELVISYPEVLERRIKELY